MPEIEELIKERDSFRQRANDLGSQFREMYAKVVGGLFIGIFIASLKGELTEIDPNKSLPAIFDADAIFFPLMALGLGAVLVLGNILWSKHRATLEYEASKAKILEYKIQMDKCRAEGSSPSEQKDRGQRNVQLEMSKPKGFWGYCFSVAHFDFIALYLLFCGIVLFLTDWSNQMSVVTVFPGLLIIFVITTIVQMIAFKQKK